MSERVTTARVRELRDAATPGPWEHEHIGYGGQEVTMDARHSVFVDGRGNAALIAAAPDLAADLLEAREELRLTTPAVDAVRGVIAALCLAPDATYTEVVAAVEERAGMLAHAVQSWKARASGMEAAEREVARLRAELVAARTESSLLFDITRGRLTPPDGATMEALDAAGGCWLVSYDDDETGDPVVTTEYLAGARDLAKRVTDGGNPARWIAVDRFGHVVAPREPAAADVARDAPGVG